MADETTQVQQQPAASSAPAAPPSTHDRLKAFLSGPTGQQPPPSAKSDPQGLVDDTAGESTQTKEPLQAPKAVPAQAVAAEAEVPDSEGDSADADVELTSVTELAERTGLTLDRIMDLSIPTKIDGKEGSTTLRQALKNFQLDGHLSNKLKAHADERKAFEAQAQRLQSDYQQKLQQVDAGVQVAQRLLQGEFASINWQELQQTDPATFNQHYVSFQHRQAMLDQIANQLGTERQTLQQQQAQQHKGFLEEQKQLLESKVPEWADSKARATEMKEMGEVFSEAYGVTGEELNALVDHRDFMVARDALKWLKLQKSRPAVLNKVRQAPKLLKPGASQSQAAQKSVAVASARDQLRKSGGKDKQALANVLKSLGVARV
jgi:hypothetical protein